MALGPLNPLGNNLPPPVEDNPIPLLPEQSETEVKGLSEEAKTALKQICDDLEKADKPAWDKMVREFKRLTYFWHGVHHLFWNETAKDWRTPQQALEERPDLDIDPDDLNKIIQIYKAHGESIIAALSASLPSTAFFPKDADNSDDIMAAKAHSKLAELIQKQNEAPLAFVKAMYTVFNCGVVAAYNYHHESDEYGTIKNPNTGIKDVSLTTETCPDCGYEFPEGSPDNGDGTKTCESCGNTVTPDVTEGTTQIPTLMGYDEEPKGREVIEIWGPLNLKIPPYIRKLRDAPYICLITEHHYTKMMELYPEIKHDIKGVSDDGERWVRDTIYGTSQNEDLVTVKRWWVRSFAFNACTDPKVEKELRDAFPNGCYYVEIQGKYAETLDESIDQHWTITESPTAETLFADPIGQPLASIQEMVDDLVALTEQTIQYGIAETFADPDVLDFDQYAKSENQPGMVYPAKALPGKPLEAGFFTLKTATLSKETSEFSAFLDKMGQFVIGDFPSVFGGFAEGGSKTLGEYQASQSRALQRLSLPWKVISSWWARTMKKSVQSFKDNMKDDEVMVQRQGKGFINVWIRKEEIHGGEIGEVYSESSDQLPIAWAQQRDLLMQLIQLNNPQINTALFSPNNAGEIARVGGFPDLVIPGDNDRNKQLYEIGELLKGQPQMNEPSVPVEPMADDHIVHIEVTKNWLVSPSGLEAKETNPAGYANVLAHLMRHIFTMSTIGAPSMDQAGGIGSVNEVPGQGNPKGNGSPQPSNTGVA